MSLLDLSRISESTLAELLMQATRGQLLRKGDILQGTPWLWSSPRYPGALLLMFSSTVKTGEGGANELLALLSEMRTVTGFGRLFLLDPLDRCGTGGPTLAAAWSDWETTRLGVDELSALVLGSPGSSTIDLRPWLVGSSPFQDLAEGARLRLFLGRELLADRYTKLSTVAMDAKRRMDLAEVFIDLPLEGESAQTACRELVNAAADPFPDREDRHRRHLLVGGPGQGKSTLAGRLCQIQRVALLQGEALEEGPAAVFAAYAQEELVSRAARRLPFLVNLPRFADALSEGSCRSLEEYLGQVVKVRLKAPIPTAVLQEWTTGWPQILVLDGLDEVPSSGNREAVLYAVREYLAQRQGIDLRVVATTRPQGYRGHLDGEGGWSVLRLARLQPNNAREYCQKLVTQWFPHDDLEQQHLLRRVSRALAEPQTAELATTPLQVLILAILLSQTGRVPQNRWRLFSEYYRVIFDRERDRENPSSQVLSELPDLIHRLHWEVGYRLHIRAERQGAATATMPHTELMAIVQERLAELGFDPGHRARLERNIGEALLERLVFLTSPREGEVGFELRSLQELAAAERLFQGPEELLRRRIEVIARPTHWRNVLLFCVGRLLAERDHILPELPLLCAEFDERPDLLDARVGTRLALALLGEPGLFRSRIKETILRFAADALSGDDQELIQMAVNRLLTLEPKRLVDELKEQLQKGTYHQVWEEIESFHSREELQDVLDAACVRWPAEMAAHIQSPNGSKSKDHIDPDWVNRCKARVTLLTPHLTAQKLLNFAEGNPCHLVALLQGTHSAWGPGTELDPKRTTSRLQIQVELPACGIEGQIAIRALLPNPPEVEWREVLSRVSPEVNQILIGLSHFWERPDHIGLANTLKELAVVPESLLAPVRPLHAHAWPLSACLNFHDRGLVTLSQDAAAGRLGNATQWEQAQKRWAEEGLSDKDDLSSEIEVPFDSSIALVGPPPVEVPRLSGQFTFTSNATPVRGDLSRSLFLGSGHARMQGQFLFPTNGNDWRILQTLRGAPRNIRYLILTAWAAGWPLGARALIEDLASQHRPHAWANYRLTRKTQLTIDLDPTRHPGMTAVFAMCRSKPVLEDLPSVNEWQWEDLSPRLAADVQMIQLMSGKTLDFDRLANGLTRSMQALGATLEAELWSIVKPPRGVDLPDRLISTLLQHARTPRLRTELRSVLAQRLASAPSGFSTSPDLCRLLELPTPAPETNPSAEASPPHTPPEVELLSLELKGIRAIGDLRVNLQKSEGSTLDGQWTCIVGLNGAGKTTLLQCLSVALLGPERAVAVAKDQGLRGLRSPDRQNASITLRLRVDGEELRLTTLLNGGPTRHDEETAILWPRISAVLDQLPFVSYGANRNLSSRPVPDDEDLSPEARRQLSLFDAGAPLAHADTLRLSGRLEGHCARLFRDVSQAVFLDYGLEVEVGKTGVTFTCHGWPRGLSGVALPDGLRATVAWIADLCRVAVDVAAAQAWRLKPEDLRAVVLIDEIDLHLHARLQRTLVSRLRAALPKVTWVVTTHSPMVLSAFDHRELRVLDARRPERLWIPDRPIMGFSTDDIIRYVLEAEPTSLPFEEKLEELSDLGEDAPAALRDEVLVAQEVSPSIDIDEARRRILLRRGRRTRAQA